MSNSIFVDSSLIVEYLKGFHKEFVDVLLVQKGYRLFISQTVVSEYLFYHLAEHGQKSPRTLKENKTIPAIFTDDPPLPFLQLFTWLPDHAGMLPLAVDYMTRYNLLPNDALILSACKHHGLPAIASFDPDFEAPCQGEGVGLLRLVDDFHKFLEKR